MGALFYNYGDQGLFKSSVGGAFPPVVIDVFQNLVTEKNLIILTDIGISVNDIVQFFTTFDDLIHYFHFGKGLGSMTCRGLLFMDCENNGFPGSDAFFDVISKCRGAEVTCSMGKTWFKGVMTEASVNIIAEPETHAQFSVNFGVIDHNIQSPAKTNPSC